MPCQCRPQVPPNRQWAPLDLLARAGPSRVRFLGKGTGPGLAACAGPGGIERELTARRPQARRARLIPGPLDSPAGGTSEQNCAAAARTGAALPEGRLPGRG